MFARCGIYVRVQCSVFFSFFFFFFVVAGGGGVFCEVTSAIFICRLSASFLAHVSACKKPGEIIVLTHSVVFKVHNDDCTKIMKLYLKVDGDILTKFRKNM